LPFRPRPFPIFGRSGTSTSSSSPPHARQNKISYDRSTSSLSWDIPYLSFGRSVDVLHFATLGRGCGLIFCPCLLGHLFRVGTLYSRKFLPPLLHFGRYDRVRTSWLRRIPLRASRHLRFPVLSKSRCKLWTA